MSTSCRRQIVSELGGCKIFVFVIHRIFEKFLISCCAKFSSNFVKYKIICKNFAQHDFLDKIIFNFATHKIKNFVKILQQSYVGLE